MGAGRGVGEMALGLKSAGSFTFRLSRPVPAPRAVLQNGNDRGTGDLLHAGCGGPTISRTYPKVRTPGGCPQAPFPFLQLLLSEAQPSPPFPL